MPREGSVRMSEESTIARPAGTVAFFTFLSRILGLIRDMVVAFSFGAASHADAFFVAFRIPNMLRRMVAEGALTASFLPVPAGRPVAPPASGSACPSIRSRARLPIPPP